MIAVGDTVRRIWGDGFMTSEMRVCAIDEKFIYCDAQRKPGESEWKTVLPEAGEKWKFDIDYGVETNERHGWGMRPYGANVVLSRIEEIKEAAE